MNYAECKRVWQKHIEDWQTYGSSGTAYCRSSHRPTLLLFIGAENCPILRVCCLYGVATALFACVEGLQQHVSGNVD